VKIVLLLQFQEYLPFATHLSLDIFLNIDHSCFW